MTKFTKNPNFMNDLIKQTQQKEYEVNKEFHSKIESFVNNTTCRKCNKNASIEFIGGKGRYKLDTCCGDFKDLIENEINAIQEIIIKNL